MSETLRAESDDLPRFVRTEAMLGGLVASATGYAPGPVAPEANPQRPLHRGLPSPYLTLIFSLAAPVVSGATPAAARGPDASTTSIMLGGLHTRPAFVVDDPQQSGIQLALHPLAARQLLGVPAAELRALVTDGVDVLGEDAERLRQRLLDRSWPERFALVAADLQVRRARTRTERVRPELVGAWAWLAANRGQGTMTELSRHVALSPRQLRALFAAEVGVGPKAVARLLRFERVIQAIGHGVRSGRVVELTTLAYACGYADLAHLDRDFAALVGLSPSEWLAQERRNLQAGGHRPGPDLST